MLPNYQARSPFVLKHTTSIIINKQTSPIFNCVTPVSFSLATLARQLIIYQAYEDQVIFKYSLSKDPLPM